MAGVSDAGVVLAVDAGTGSARVIAVDATGAIVARAAREWTHRPLAGHPGGTVFDTGAGWEAISSALAEVAASVGPRRIRALAPSAMREGFVLYDGEGAELWACPNTDGRARTQADELVASGAADRIFAVGGDWVSITAPSRIRWIAEHQPELLARTRHLGMLSDWIAYRLTGEFTTEPTCGSSSALFDLASRTWSPELAALAGIDVGILPPVVESGTVVGAVTAAAAAQTGLPEGLPVVAGGADTQLALYAFDAGPKVPTVVAGTFWQTTAVTTTLVIDPERRLRTLCHVTPGSWMVEGIGFLSGLAMRWARDALFPDDPSYERLEGEALAVPAGANGVRAVLSNVMRADGWHHAAPAFAGFDLGDPEGTGRGAFVRAIEEAAAYVARAHLDILDELTGGSTATDELVFTGGSSGGSLWPQVMADVTGRRVRCSTFAEATSMGAARLAAGAVGIELPAVRTDEHAVRPGPDAKTYDRLYGEWFGLYRAMREATVASGLDPLFVPPGGLPYRPAVRRKEGVGDARN
jgi:autoinducer 2 (AI-2) kinase